MTTQFLTAPTYAGDPWTPRFLRSINDALCIGCGRCFKACGRGVLRLRGLDEDGALIEDEEDEYVRQVMTILVQGNCIGCEGCARACPKNCLEHAPLPI